MEYQDLTAANALPFFNGKIKYKTIIGLSGTHPKHQEKIDIYNKLKLKTLTEMSIDEAVENGLVAPYNIKVIELTLDTKDKYIKAGSKLKPFMQTEEAKYPSLTKLINAKLFARQDVPAFFYLNRMRFIYDLKSKQQFVKKFVKQLQGRTLIFTGSIAQAEDICKYNFHSGRDDTDLTAFKEGKINTLACVNSGGVGHTFKDVQNVVIAQVNSNGKGDSTQKIARGLVLQEGHVANIYLFYVANTVDEKWVQKVLEDFDQSKVEYISGKNYE